MKLLITSVDAIIDAKTNTYFKGIKAALDFFQDLHEDNSVWIISISEEKLKSIPNDFQKLPIGNYALRKSPKLIKIISEHTGLEYNDIIVLGGKDDDMILAANAKLLLLTADYAKSNNSDDRIYINGYGVRISSAERLKLFFERYLNVDVPWYYSLDVDKNTKLFGLTNAMTKKMGNTDVKEICEQFRDFLKDGNLTYKNQFRIYSLICVSRIYKYIEDVNYWGYYPSSSTSRNQELFQLKEILRKAFNSRNDNDILIRHTNSPKRHTLSSSNRITNGCNSQFDTIHLNPYFRGKLKGKNVCIIDDFTNIGSSCETVRYLLKEAGVNKVIFIALGKFRDEYIKYNYIIKGDVFSKTYTYQQIGNGKIYGTINNSASNELYESLKHILD